MQFIWHIKIIQERLNISHEYIKWRDIQIFFINKTQLNSEEFIIKVSEEFVEMKTDFIYDRSTIAVSLIFTLSNIFQLMWLKILFDDWRFMIWFWIEKKMF